MNPTSQQQALVDALLGTTSNLALVARAGTGKTSTILMAAIAYCRANPSHAVVICAFGRAIAAEIKEKLEKLGVDWKKLQAATTHSLGFSLVRHVFKGVKVDERKVIDLIDAANGDVFREWSSQIRQLVHLAKLSGVGFFPDAPIADVMVWHTLADHYDVNGLDDTSQMEEIVAAAQYIYKASLTKTDVVDYDDMVLFPLIKNLRVKFQKDLIFVDEYQDTSRARQALIRKFLKPSGRIVIVGDDRQAIMGFAGAETDAMEMGIKDTQATVLPLTVTWRCPRAVVKEAQTLVPDIEASEGAAEGEVVRLEKLPTDEMEPNRDAILCRNTAPLIQIAYSMIRQGKAVKVEGRAIGEGLISLARRWKIRSISTLLDRLEVYLDREVQKYQAKRQEAKIEAVTDKVATLTEICQMCLARGLTEVQNVIEHVENLFADGAKNAIICATYHRSKGREWERVYLFEHGRRCPSPMARQDWQRRQEANLAYVAITRAKERLAYVN